MNDRTEKIVIATVASVVAVVVGFVLANWWSARTEAIRVANVEISYQPTASRATAALATATFDVVTNLKSVRYGCQAHWVYLVGLGGHSRIREDIGTGRIGDVEPGVSRNWTIRARLPSILPFGPPAPPTSYASVVYVQCGTKKYPDSPPSPVTLSSI